jgi:hypothetical protein
MTTDAEDIIFDHAHALAAAGAQPSHIVAAFVATGTTEAIAAGHGPELAATLRSIADRIERGDVPMLAPAGSACMVYSSDERRPMRRCRATQADGSVAAWETARG